MLRRRVSLSASRADFHEGATSHHDTCENCGAKLADSNNNKALLTRLLSMETAIAWRRKRITCDEEERFKYGYNITTYFRYDQQKRQSATIQTADGTELLRLTYGATADIWHINRGLNKKKVRNEDLNSISKLVFGAMPKTTQQKTAFTPTLT